MEGIGGNGGSVNEECVTLVLEDGFATNNRHDQPVFQTCICSSTHQLPARMPSLVAEPDSRSFESFVEYASGIQRCLCEEVEERPSVVGQPTTRTSSGVVDP